MNTEKKLTVLNKRMESYRPKLEGREELLEEVMSSISEKPGSPVTELLSAFLFGWTDILWIRRSLVSASLLLVFIFVFQQYSIMSRIGRLENRMVNSSTDQIIRQQGEYVLLNSLLRQEVGERDLRDSIMVADKDLRDLINSYSELEKRYKELKQEYYSQRFKENTNKQKL